jgi:hypothetical protein
MTATVTNLNDWRALRWWAAAAAHLNERGYVAAVPAGLVPALSRRGLIVWAAEERGTA